MSKLVDEVDHIIEYLNREIQDEFSEVINTKSEYHHKKTRITDITRHLDSHFNKKFEQPVSAS